MSRWIGGDGAAPTVELVMQGSDYGVNTVRSDNGNTHSVTGVAFGDNHSTRQLIAVLGVAGDWSSDLDSSGVVNNFTVGGTAVDTIISKYRHGTGSGGKYTQLLIGKVKPAGTSGTVRWTCPVALNTNSGSFCAIYRTKFLKRTPVITSADGAIGASGWAEAPLSVLSHSVVIGAYFDRDVGGFVWDWPPDGNQFMQCDGPLLSGKVYNPSGTTNSSGRISFAHNIANQTNSNFVVEQHGVLSELGILSAVALR